MNQNITLIDFVFSKLRTPTTESDKCLKSPVSEDASTSNMVNVAKNCWNLHDSTFIIFIGDWQRNCVRKSLCYSHAPLHLYPIDWSLKSQLSWKKSLLFTCQILGLLVNTLAANEKYLVLHRETLTISFLMQLPQKQNTFSQFWAAFLKSRLNFGKKVNPRRFCIFEITDSENVVR